jgi:hypothetical protein
MTFKERFFDPIESYIKTKTIRDAYIKELSQGKVPPYLRLDQIGVGVHVIGSNQNDNAEAITSFEALKQTMDREKRPTGIDIYGNDSAHIIFEKCMFYLLASYDRSQNIGYIKLDQSGAYPRKGKFL